MKMNEIIAVIAHLSKSLGYYGRLNAQLAHIKEFEPERYKRIVAELEAQKFKEPLDIILYFEKGRPGKNDGTK